MWGGGDVARRAASVTRTPFSFLARSLVPRSFRRSISLRHPRAAAAARRPFPPAHVGTRSSATAGARPAAAAGISAAGADGGRVGRRTDATDAANDARVRRSADVDRPLARRSLPQDKKQLAEALKFYEKAYQLEPQFQQAREASAAVRRNLEKRSA